MSATRYKRDYMAYKRVCSKVKEGDDPDLSTLTLEELQQHYQSLLENFVYATKCFKQREEFRDRHIPEEKRDEGHEKSIEVYKQTAERLSDRMKRVIREINSRQEPSTVGQNALVEEKKEDPRTKRSRNRKGKSRNRNRVVEDSDLNLDLYLQTAHIYEEEEQKEIDAYMDSYERAIMSVCERMKPYLSKQRKRTQCGPTLVEYYVQLDNGKRLDTYTIEELDSITTFDREVVSLAQSVASVAGTQGVIILTPDGIYTKPLDSEVENVFDIINGKVYHGIASKIATPGTLLLSARVSGRCAFKFPTQNQFVIGILGLLSMHILLLNTRLKQLEDELAKLERVIERIEKQVKETEDLEERVKLLELQLKVRTQAIAKTREIAKTQDEILAIEK